MKNRQILLVFLLIFLSGFVSAYQTNIIVQTEPDRFVFIQADNSYNQEKVKYVNLLADVRGIARTEISSVTDRLDISIKITDNQGIIIDTAQYNNYLVGGALVANFLGEASVGNICSYPSKIDCNTEDEVHIIEKEWQDSLCTRDEMGICLSAWVKFQEENKCTPSWNCGDWSNCVNGQRTRNCNDGCGNTKTEREACCVSNWECSYFKCVNQSYTLLCKDGCGKSEIRDSGEKCTTLEESYQQNLDEQRKRINELNLSTHQVVNINDYPIIFVHGWTGSGSSFDELEKSIKWDTQIVQTSGTAKAETYNIDYSDITCSNLAEYGIREHALQLQKEIDKALSNSRYYKVNIIAHSMGGLTARYYINYLGGDKKVHKLIMLGTPNHGANGNLGGLIEALIKNGCNYNQDKSLKDLNFNSQFLNDLNSNDETYGDVEYYTIYTSSDHIVGSGVQLSGAKNYEDTQCTSHANLIIPSNCNNAYNQILDALIINQYYEEKINSEFQQQSQFPITGDTIVSQEKLCIKRLLGFLWCIKWEIK